ncbi:alpha-2-macroglobulin-like protein 1 isoform X2 [Tachysurus vachellii]|uniref:alpha-2-macroglobulin-like protein 1 isoform X2 n=1 Tax=Tachysurus vachellii TaxID=175792 RepID=UPI00296AFB4C|nr:alpha-2-macroglobulin-like protein 1 isoform X2 [Tachysurus vachellii]
MGPSRITFTLFLLFASTIVQASFRDKNPSDKDKDKHPPDKDKHLSDKDKDKHPFDHDKDLQIRLIKHPFDQIKDKHPFDQIKDKHLSDRDKDKHLSDRDKHKHPFDQDKDKHLSDRDKHKHLSDRDKDKHLSDRDKDKHLSDRDKDKHLSDRDKHKHPSDRDKDKHLSDRDKDKHLSDRDKDKHLSDRDKDKHLSDRDKDKHLSDRDKHKHPSDRDKDKHLSDRDKHKHPSDRDKDKHLSDRDKDKHLSDRDKDKHLSDRDKDKHPSDRDKDKHPSDKDKDKHPSDKDRHPSDKDQEKHPSDKDKRPSDKDKDKRPSDKDKDKRPSDKDKDKHPSDKDKRPSDKDKDKHPSDKDQEKHPSDKDKRPSDKDKDKRPSDKDKDKRPSDKDKDKRPSDKDKRPSDKDKERHPSGTHEHEDGEVCESEEEHERHLAEADHDRLRPTPHEHEEGHPSKPDKEKENNPPQPDKGKPPSKPDKGKPPSKPDKVKPPSKPDKVKPPSKPDKVKPPSKPDKVKPPSKPDKDEEKPPSKPDKDEEKPPSKPDKVKPPSKPDKVKPPSKPDKVKPPSKPDKVKPPSKPDKVKPPSKPDKQRKESSSESDEHDDWLSSESDEDDGRHPSKPHEDRHPSEHDEDRHPSEHDEDRHPSEDDEDRHPSEDDEDRHPSEHDEDRHPSEHDEDRHPSEHDEDRHPSEHDEDRHPSEHDEDRRPSEHDEDRRPSRPHKDTFYLLAVTSRTVGGTTETLCIIVKPSGYVSLNVYLDYNQKHVLLLTEKSITKDYYHSVKFQVPVVTEELVASITIEIKGRKRHLKKATKIIITPPKFLTIIQTDKPIYKPGQRVKFRIASLDTNFHTYEQKFPTIQVQDPNSNRIGQWLNVPTSSGLVDLSYPLNSEATKGVYVITVHDKKNTQFTQTFEVKDYVLPTFEVTVELPPVITILDTKATLKVCAKYTYGKPVRGTVRATVCRKSYKFKRPQWGPTPPDICKNYTIKTDETGCGQKLIDLTEYALRDSRYEPSIVVRTEVEEDGTGVILTGSGRAPISPNIVSLLFEDSPAIFKPRIAYDGRIKATGPNSSPIKRKVVYLTISYTDKSSVRKLVTNDKGIAKFSLDTQSWGLNQVSLQAQYETTQRPVISEINRIIPQYQSAFLSLQPFYSRSQSFIKLRSCSAPLSCIKKAVVRAQYRIHNSALAPGQRTISFFYIVLNKGHLVQQGRITEAINPKTAVHKGNLVLTLQHVTLVSPVAQVVLYTVLHSGEAVADSINLPVQPCLANKVSLKFSPSTELPGDQASLLLKAAPGSLCSVKAIDKSLLLLQPEKELSIQSVFDLLPVKSLSGYPYNIIEEDLNPCPGSPPIGIRPLAPEFRKIGFIPHFGKLDVYSTFKDIGVKVITNTEIKKPVDCLKLISAAREKGTPEVLRKDTTSVDSSSREVAQPVVTIRKYFPETWIWDLVPVSQSGVTAINKTVPDSITTWQADAFCTSPVGFGVAPKTELIAFQPFFVSLTLPSSVIRGEVFTLKATVFNYLKSCMVVKVTLARSKKFSVQQCKNCSYTKCLCADESRTFSWTITPHVLGEIRFNVTAEAVQSTLCGNKIVVPEKGRIDTVIKKLLVLAEGVKRYKSYNELLCPSDDVKKKTVSLTLPKIFVEGSEIASVSVLGDLMGRALQNLASLLAMPYGCGEQNMLLFAPNIFILQYLESTNQLTPQIRSTAQTYLIGGYQRELTYKHNDGSYSAFGMSDRSGNTWLTAFVMKSFGNAKRYIFIDQVFVDQAKSWLGQQQQANGCFASVGQLFHLDMKGGVNDEVTLTAYITAAMLELNYTAADPVVNNGLTCLRNAFTQVNSTYTKALLFYTFTLAGNHRMRNTLISGLDAVAIVSGGGRHWSRASDGSVTDSLEVEMTSYVLLALMSGPELPGFGLGYSTSIVNWLSQQQNSFGGFASTQDTVVALQALAKYGFATYSPAGSVTVTITSPSGQIITFTINQSNRLLYQERELQEVPGDYNVKAKGKGCVYVQFNLRYHIPPPPGHSSFTILASANGNCRVPIPILEVKITVTYNGHRLKTNMVVIEVKALSGFRVDATSVQLVNGNSNFNDGVVQRVDQTEERAIIYLNKLTNGKERVYTLKIIQDLSVQNLRPAVVTVYDYYYIGERAATEYSSPCPYQRNTISAKA